MRPLESKKVKVTFQPVSAKSVRRVIEELRIIFCLFYRPLVSLHLSHPAGEFTFEPSGGELKPLESKKVKVTFQPVSAKSVRRVIEELRIIFCLFYRPLVSLHLSHPAES